MKRNIDQKSDWIDTLTTEFERFASICAIDEMTIANKIRRINRILMLSVLLIHSGS